MSLLPVDADNASKEIVEIVRYLCGGFDWGFLLLIWLNARYLWSGVNWILLQHNHKSSSTQEQTVVPTEMCSVSVHLGTNLIQKGLETYKIVASS